MLIVTSGRRPQSDTEARMEMDAANAKQEESK